MDVQFRPAPTPAPEKTPVPPEPEKNNERVQSGPDKSEPIEIWEAEGKSVVLDALDIEDTIDTLPEQDKQNVNEVKQYVTEIMKSRGLAPTVAAFRKTLDSIKENMGLDKDAEPSALLDRVSGVVRAWRDLAFITDSAVKKSIFMKLANLKSSEEMNKVVYTEMEKYKVWR